MEKGSYLKEKMLEGDFALSLIEGSQLIFDDVTLEIEEHPYLFNGSMFFNTEPKSYEFQIDR